MFSGLALLELNDLDAAQRCLFHARKGRPSDRDISEALERLNKRRVTNKALEKEL